MTFIMMDDQPGVNSVITFTTFLFFFSLLILNRFILIDYIDNECLACTIDHESETRWENVDILGHNLL